MNKRRFWKSPWRREVTPEERAETARMLSEYVARQPHAPASPAAREAIVRELIDVAREAPPVELPEQLPLALTEVRSSLSRWRSSTEITGAAAMVMRSIGVPVGKWNHGLVLCMWRLVMMSPLRVRRIIESALR